MAFIEAKCKNCGGDIRLDENMTHGRCEYCGTEFVKSDMIVHNNYAIQNATLVLNEEDVTEQMFINAETYLTTLWDYTKAFETYRMITQSKVNDYRGWWGLVRSLSHNFTVFQCSEQDYTQMRSYANNAIQLAQSPEKDTLVQQWNNYRQQVESYLASRNAEFARQMAEQQAKARRAAQRRHLRRIIPDMLSIAVNIVVVCYCLTISLRPLHYQHDPTPLIYIGSALAINAVLAVIFQLVGSAPECFIFQVIATLTVLAYTGYHFAADGNPDTTVLIVGIIVVSIGGLLAAAVFLVFPLLVYRHLTKKSRL